MTTVNFKYAKKDNGTVFVYDYKLKRDTAFEEDKRREFGDPALKEIQVAAGTPITIEVSKTHSGNYGCFKYRSGTTLYIHRISDPQSIQLLIDAFYNPCFDEYSFVDQKDNMWS
jgi:hypothetical protein